jgi:hypothetical protein
MVKGNILEDVSNLHNVVHIEKGTKVLSVMNNE